MSSPLEAILTKLYMRYDGSMKLGASINISWEQFAGVLSSGEKPVYGSIRTIREKWQQLHYAGFLKEINQHASRVNVPALLKAIGKYPGE